MASPKDDASTDIEAKVTSFAKNMTDACADIRKARIAKNEKEAGKSAKKPAEPPVVSFKLSKNPATQSRTPAEQALQVANGKSWVCWSGHMSDRARHVNAFVDGKFDSTFKIKTIFGPDVDRFKSHWAGAMKSQGLKNFKGADGWGEGDEMHLELPEAKITKADERAQACMEEYVRLTRVGGKSQNDKFEKAYKKDLAEFIKKYEKKDGKK